MLPHLGAGAGTGIEDVLLLVRLLTRPETQSSNLTVRRPPLRSPYVQVRPCAKFISRVFVSPF